MKFGSAIRSYGRFPIKMMGDQCRFLSLDRFHARVSPVSLQNLRRFTSFGVRFLRFCQACKDCTYIAIWLAMAYNHNAILQLLATRSYIPALQYIHCMMVAFLIRRKKEFWP
jgi:hypothetical protein